PMKGKTALRQFIVNRPLIDEPRRTLEAQGFKVAFADCWDESGDKAIKLNFLAPQGREVPAPLRPSSVYRFLGVLSLMLAGSAAYFTMQRGETALAALDVQIAEAKSRAQSIRQTIDQASAAATEAAALQRLHTRAIAPMTVLHELTRLLPDDAYLTELRISGATVAMSGLAAKAVALLPVIDKSDVFEAVQITAPVLFEAALNKEQFRIEAHVTGAAEPATNAQAEQP
ncbi:MAG: PilN domain-containing protein, partial [Hyphomicrobium sp.]